MVPTGNKAKRLSSVEDKIKTIYQFKTSDTLASSADNRLQ